MTNLAGLDLSKNNLNGSLPLELGNLNMLGSLNLSHNRFSRILPSSIERMKRLVILDVSYNNLEGPVPKGFQYALVNWFIHNMGLCGDYIGLPPCYSPPTHNSRNKRQKIVIAIGILLLASVLSGIMIFYIRWKRKPEDTSTTIGRDVFSI